MSSFQPRLAYFGLPLGALALASRGIVPRVIALGHPDAEGARRVRRRLGSSSLILARPDLSRPEVVRLLESLAPDALLSWFWPKRIPPQVLALPRCGSFGVHPSLLPRWRGPDPYFWTLRSGDDVTGVSLHRLEASYDTGNVIRCVKLQVGPHDDAWRLARRLDRPSLRLLTWAAEQLAAGQALDGESQEESRATAAPFPDDEDLALSFTAGTEDVIRLVRAAAPNPGASAQMGEQVVEVLAVERFSRTLPKALEPGDAVMCDGRVVVATADGAVVVRAVRDEDGHVLRDEAVAGLFGEGLTRWQPALPS